ncbi:hypothetical protein LJC22_00615 [Desulfosarcina sp. OttesenSCG-928-G10]|nr:hypothetical protein [Desulfosarcina sp. OttesenSCG-928-G10]MDL2320920.1 hypothetical protein [Desulfosarcina sp. OttesenSCG-928-B08]
MGTMTPEERARLLQEAHRLSDNGDEEGSRAIYRMIPLPADLLKTLKSSFGGQILKDIGYNYSEAEALYGTDWLDR